MHRLQAVAPGTEGSRGQRDWSRAVTWEAAEQAGAGALPKVPDVTLQAEQGGAHTAPASGRRGPAGTCWAMLGLAATGPFEGGEVWLGHLWGVSSLSFGGAISPKKKAWPLSALLPLGPQTCLVLKAAAHS